MDNVYLPFEDEIEKIDRQIDDLKKYKIGDGVDCSGEINGLKKTKEKELGRIYSGLTPWQTVQVARHPERPVFDDYLVLMVKNPRELCGDRCFGDDPAMYTGFGTIGMKRVLVIGTRKGRDTASNIKYNFGCPNPEGYRKAISKMKLAEKFGVPVVTLIDTPGANPGIEAEERGQAQAIAVNLREMSRLRVPIVSVVIGEGGSGGALGIGVANSLGMMEHAYYSVISPEGCAGILWHDGSKADKAAEALKLNSEGARRLRAIEHIVKEPLGGAHRGHYGAAVNLEEHILRELRKYEGMSGDKLVEQRRAIINKRAGDWMIDRTDGGWKVKKEVKDLWKGYGTTKD